MTKLRCSSDVIFTKPDHRLSYALVRDCVSEQSILNNTGVDIELDICFTVKPFTSQSSTAIRFERSGALARYHDDLEVIDYKKTHTLSVENGRISLTRADQKYKTRVSLNNNAGITIVTDLTDATVLVEAVATLPTEFSSDSHKSPIINMIPVTCKMSTGHGTKIEPEKEMIIKETTGGVSVASTAPVEIEHAESIGSGGSWGPEFNEELSKTFLEAVKKMHLEAMKKAHTDTGNKTVKEASNSKPDFAKLFTDKLASGEKKSYARNGEVTFNEAKNKSISNIVGVGVVFNNAHESYDYKFISDYEYIFTIVNNTGSRLELFAKIIFDPQPHSETHKRNVDVIYEARCHKGNNTATNWSDIGRGESSLNISPNINAFRVIEPGETAKLRIRKINDNAHGYSGSVKFTAR